MPLMPATVKKGAWSLTTLKPPRLVSRPSMTPVSSAGGTSPKAMVVGFAPQADSAAFSTGLMERILRPAKSSGLSRREPEPAPM